MLCSHRALTSRCILMLQVQLAQADLQIIGLKGQVSKERERSRQLASKLTELQSQHDSLIDQRNAMEQALAGVAAVATPPISPRGGQQVEGPTSPPPAKAAGGLADHVTGATGSLLRSFTDMRRRLSDQAAEVGHEATGGESRPMGFLSSLVPTGTLVRHTSA